MATKLGDRLSLFRSARWSLTLFYLSIIVLFNLFVAVSVRVYAERQFQHANAQQRLEIEQLQPHLSHSSASRYRTTISGIQSIQSAIVSQHLNRSLLVINLFSLLAGGVLSYWFAGKALRPIQAAHEVQARFTADASHEMKTPLANMRLENEIFLRQKMFTQEEAREQIESNLEEVHRLEKLSLNLLALHQYGHASLERSSVSVEPLVQSAIDQISATAAARNVSISSELATSKVLVHEDSILQLLAILLDNALKYGGKDNEISMHGHKHGKSYVLSVSDKGPGIAPRDLPHIFDRLYRSDRARSTKTFGYGLGLSLAKEIADANMANIVARNNAGGGARFEVWLTITT